MLNKNIVSKFQADNLFSLPDSLVFLANGGSYAYGLETPESDRDIFGVVVPPQEFVLCPFPTKRSKPFRVWRFKDDDIEGQIHSIEHFTSMLVNGNPNACALLFNEPSDRASTSAFEVFIDNRDQFVNVELLHAMLGFATNELADMRRTSPDMGERRNNLVKRYGYNPRMACNAIRMLKMIVECMETNNLNVRRTIDRDELLSIKQGTYTENEVLSLADVLLTKIKRGTYDRETKSAEWGKMCLMYTYRCAWSNDDENLFTLDEQGAISQSGTDATLVGTRQSI